ncbi:uncharacterized protein LOC111324698 isoform X2 [Stylophora pistillata]|uniref:uncharacterized protein LOC111324698 isoform X2 n=1 Tax=Stylophora pistillata TaxID=50429 RepID=UPI000C055995|nr:uncharacterized protein LOC111324698 isoform X2 [Stylophora pistillata]
MTLALVFLVLFFLTVRATQAVECLEPASRVISRWKNGNYYKGEIESITNRVNVLFDNGARLAFNPRDNVDIVVDRIPEQNDLPWGSQILVNRPKSRAFEIGYIRDIKNGRYVILYEDGDMILHSRDQIRAFNKSKLCDEPAYLGCFRDNLPRDLEVYIPTHPATIGACVDTCKWQGFSVAALRNSDLCFCGNAYRKANQVPDAKCDMPCYDNSFEVCGGFMTFSQYWTGIVDSPPAGGFPGIQKHFIPSNHPIPWQLLMHARSRYPPRNMPGSTRGAAWYQSYPYKGMQLVSGWRNYPSSYQGKLFYPPSGYQGYQQYYGAKPYTTNYNANHFQQPSSAYSYQAEVANNQAKVYGAYQGQAYRWPYNYNSYKYSDYNVQKGATNRPYSSYQKTYQKRPAHRPSPQEHAKLMALAAPRFLGCYQDSESRDLPTEVPVKPLTVEGCVSKCGETGFSIAGLQSSTQCFCGSTYSKYGRLNDKQCSMRCTGNYQEICGGVMMNSLYYTGVGQAIPNTTPSVDLRTQQITYTKNTPLSSYTENQSKHKPRPLVPMKPSPFHKLRLPKAKPKATKVKDKTLKIKPKKITQSKQKEDESKGKPLPMQDYAKLTKMLQMLSRWQQPQPLKLKPVHNVAKVKPTLSYQELRKVLEDMTPDIVKKIANQIIAHDRNKTRLSDMKPLSAEKSLEVHLASKLAGNKDAGFKRVHVKSPNFKNWSNKGNYRSSSKVRNKHEDAVLEDDAQPLQFDKNGDAAKALPKNTSKQILSKGKDPKVSSSVSETGDKDVQGDLETNEDQLPVANNKIGSDTEESLRYSTQRISSVQTTDGNKTHRLPSFIPIADKRRKHKLKHKTKQSSLLHSQLEESTQNQPHDDSKSDVQSNKRTFVNFIITESHNKKKKPLKTKNDSLRKNANHRKIAHTAAANVSSNQEKVHALEKDSVQNGTNQSEVHIATEEVSSTSDREPTQDIDEVFDVNDISKNNTVETKNIEKTGAKLGDTTVEKVINSSHGTGVKQSNNTLLEQAIKIAKKKITHPLILLKYPGIPHKVLHVEAKWNGQFKVKANWKDESETVKKSSKNSFVKKNSVKFKEKTSKGKERNGGDDEGNDEYKFDDSGSRNNLVWKKYRTLKSEVH